MELDIKSMLKNIENIICSLLNGEDIKGYEYVKDTYYSSKEKKEKSKTQSKKKDFLDFSDDDNVRFGTESSNTLNDKKGQKDKRGKREDGKMNNKAINK